jgi:hypothetical protein
MNTLMSIAALVGVAVILYSTFRLAFPAPKNAAWPVRSYRSAGHMREVENRPAGMTRPEFSGDFEEDTLDSSGFYGAYHGDFEDTE